MDRSIDKEGIGERIDQVINKLNIKKKDFAEKINVTASYVSKWILGIQYPHIKFLSKMKDEFNVNLNWLASGEGSMFIDDMEAIEDPNQNKELLFAYNEVVKTNKSLVNSNRALSEFTLSQIEDLSKKVEDIENRVKKDQEETRRIIGRIDFSKADRLSDLTLSLKEGMDETKGLLEKILLATNKN